MAPSSIAMTAILKERVRLSFSLEGVEKGGALSIAYTRLATSKYSSS
jgi:hypothetical protein